MWVILLVPPSMGESYLCLARAGGGSRLGSWGVNSLSLRPGLLSPLASTTPSLLSPAPVLGCRKSPPPSISLIVVMSYKRRTSLLSPRNGLISCEPECRVDKNTWRGETSAVSSNVTVWLLLVKLRIFSSWLFNYPSLWAARYKWAS